MLTSFRGHRFPSMGTTVSLLGPAEGAFDEVAARVERIFHALDARFSRFKADSELSAVNANAGEWTTVSEEFAEVLSIAMDGARMTGGLFDPTILPALVAAGYDRDFAQMRRDGVSPAAPPPQAGRWEAVELRGLDVWLPPEMSLDFGGVAKGWAVDRAAEAARGRLSWTLVDAGGDLRVAGTVGEDGIEVAVEDPLDRDAEAMRLRLEDGALATSSLPSRSWGPDLHQLIDPRTSLPARTGAVQATAWDDTCAQAEVLAKWLLLGGPAVLDEVAGALVMDDGRLITNLAPGGDSRHVSSRAHLEERREERS